MIGNTNSVISYYLICIPYACCDVLFLHLNKKFTMGISLLSRLSSSFVLNLFWCWSRNKADLTVVPMGHSVEKHVNQA